MNHLKYLEFQRLMKELQFVESDYQYQSEIIRVSDIDFFKNVNFVLEKFPELKEIYYKKQDENLSRVIDNQDIAIVEVDSDLKDESSEVKKIYRDIVKSTHPDKIKNAKLNDLYIEATEAYEKNDIITLYKVCSELKIEIDFPEDLINEVREKINTYKRQISFLEKTFTYKWIKSDEKNKIIVEFIKSKIS